MIDGHATTKDYLVLHHTVGTEYREKEPEEMARIFSDMGRRNGLYGERLAKNPNYDSAHRNPFDNSITYTPYGYTIYPYTKDGNKYGWKIVTLLKYPEKNVTWSVGVWKINQRSLNVAVPGNWVGRKLPDEACMLIADTFRPHDVKIGGKLQVTGHQQFVATACPGGIMANRATIIDMINDPKKWNNKLFKKEKMYTEKQYNDLINKLKEKERELKDTKSKYDKSIKNLNAKINNKDTQINSLEENLENSEKYITGLEKKIKKIEDDVVVLKNKLDESLQEINRLESSQDNNSIDFKKYLDYLETNKYQIFLVGLGWLISFLTSSELTQNVTWIGSIIVVLQQIQSWAIAQKKKKKSPEGL